MDMAETKVADPHYQKLAGSIPANAADVAYAPERSKPQSQFMVDQDGNPHGGFSHGSGFSITWLDNPGDQQYGATLEDVLEVCAQRLRFFQASRFACPENERSLIGIASAIANLELRTEIRRQRGVEGTYEA